MAKATSSKTVSTVKTPEKSELPTHLAKARDKLSTIPVKKLEGQKQEKASTKVEENFISRCKKIVAHLNDNKIELDDKAKKYLNDIINLYKPLVKDLTEESKLSYGFKSTNTTEDNIQLMILACVNNFENRELKNDAKQLSKLLYIALLVKEENSHNFDYTHLCNKCIRYSTKLLSLFGTYKNVVEYLNHVNESAVQPIHDACLFELPDEKEIWDKDKWVKLILLHGKKASDYLQLAPKIDAALKKNTDIKKDDKHSKMTESQLPDIKQIHQLALSISYKRSAENPELATLALKHKKTERTFEMCLSLIQAKKIPKKFDLLPNFTLEHKEKDSKYTFKKLPTDDLRGLFLGEYTACCQSVGSTGGECALHGMTSPYSGFYVVTDDRDRIIAQTWAWIGLKGEIVLDSWEYVNKKDQTHLCKSFLEKTTKIFLDHGFSSVMMGAGGNTPRDLKFQEAKELARQRDYNGYSDAKHGQLIVSEAKSNDLMVRFKEFAKIQKLSMHPWINQSNSVDKAITALSKESKNCDPNSSLQFSLFLYKNGYSFLHELIRENKNDRAIGILKNLEGHASDLLSLTDHNGTGNTCFHLAALYNSHLLDIMIQQLKSPEELIRILKIKNNNGQTVLHLAAEFNKVEILTILRKYLNEAQLHQLLMADSILSDAIAHSSVNFVTQMLKQYHDPNLRHSLVTSTDKVGMPSLSKLPAKETDALAIVEAVLKHYSHDGQKKNAVLLQSTPYNSSVIATIASKSLKVFDKVLETCSKDEKSFDELIRNFHVVKNLHREGSQVFAGSISTLSHYCNLDQRIRVLTNHPPDDKFNNLSAIVTDGNELCLDIYLKNIDALARELKKQDAKTFKESILLPRDQKGMNTTPLHSLIYKQARHTDPVNENSTAILFKYYEEHFSQDKNTLVQSLLNNNEYWHLLTHTASGNFVAFRHIFNLCKEDKSTYAELAKNIEPIFLEAVRNNNKRVVNFLLAQNPPIITAQHLTNAFQIDPQRYMDGNLMTDYRDHEMQLTLWKECQITMDQKACHEMLIKKDKDGKGIILNLLMSPKRLSYHNQGGTRPFEIAQTILNQCCQDEKTREQLLRNRDSERNNALHLIASLDPDRHSFSYLLELIVLLSEEKTLNGMLLEKNSRGLTPEAILDNRGYPYKYLRNQLTKIFALSKKFQELSALKKTVNDSKWEKHEQTFFRGSKSTLPPDIQSLRKLLAELPEQLTPAFDDQEATSRDSHFAQIFNAASSLLADINTKFPGRDLQQHLESSNQPFKKT